MFLIAYLLVVGPLNVLLLRRLGRPQLAWVTIPVVAVAFAAGVCAGDDRGGAAQSGGPRRAVLGRRDGVCGDEPQRADGLAVGGADVGLLVVVGVVLAALLAGFFVGAAIQGVVDELPLEHLPMLWINGFLLWGAFGTFGLAASAWTRRRTVHASELWNPLS